MPGKCSFKEYWLSDENARFSKWLRPVEDDKYKAFCTFCKAKFDVGHSGLGSVKVHEAGKKHAELSSCILQSKQSTLNFLKVDKSPRLTQEHESTPSTSSSSGIVTSAVKTCVESANTTSHSSKSPDFPSTLNKYCIDDSVWKAEILWALNKVMTHASDRGSCISSDLFPVMFPDSVIAQKFKMQKDKIGYVTVFGLGPFFQHKLSDALQKCTFFAVSLDESLNRIAQKGQMDIIVRYWDPSMSTVSTRYLSSVFLGHATAADLLDAFMSSMQDLGLRVKNVLQIALDGPNVNLKFLRDFNQIMEKSADNDKEKKLIDVGTCSLHTVHGAYKTGHNKCDWQVNNFLRALYYLFKDFPSRRADFIKSSGSTEFPLKMCSIRWVENSRVIERALRMVPHLRKYVAFVDSKRPETKNFGVVEGFLKDKLLEAKLSFLQSVVKEVEPYLTSFQSDNPMLPFVYAELYSMARSIAGRFVKRDVMSTVKNTKQLLAVDVKNNLSPTQNVEIGFGAKNSCKNVKELDVQLFRKDCRSFLLEMYLKLTGPKSPLRKSMVKGAACLSPAVMLNETLRVKYVTIALDELTTKNHILDIDADLIKKNYLAICEQPTVQEKLKTFDISSHRLDTFLCGILLDTKANQALLSFCTMIFTMFHGNSAVERGFSINKECLVENMNELSLISQRSIYSAVQAVGGITNIEICSGMIRAARRASSKRKEAIEKKKLKENQEASNLKTTMETLAKLEAKKRKLLLEAEEEASVLQKEIEREKKKMKNM